MSYSVVIKRQILSILTKKNNLAFAGSLISIKVNDFSVICIRKLDHKSLLIMLEDLALSLTHNFTRSPIHCTYINFMQKKINMYYPEETRTCTYWFNLLYTKLYIKQFYTYMYICTRPKQKHYRIISVA